MKSKFYLHFIEEYFKTKQRIMKKFKKKTHAVFTFNCIYSN